MSLSQLCEIHRHTEISVSFLRFFSAKNRGSPKYQFAPVFDNRVDTRFHPEMPRIVDTDVRKIPIVGKGERVSLRAGVALSPFVLHRADYEECGGSIGD